MSLVDDGTLDLDAPVADLLPELAAPRVLRTREGPLDDTVAAERPITARHLLGGTAGHGFATWESPVPAVLMERLGQAESDVHLVPGPDEWMRRLGEIPLMHQPGEGWTYNASYDVLGVLAGRATGKGFAEVMAERILEPLGMADTGFHVPARQPRPVHHALRRGRRRPRADRPAPWRPRPPVRLRIGVGRAGHHGRRLAGLRSDAARRWWRGAPRGVRAPDDDRPHHRAGP